MFDNLKRVWLAGEVKAANYALNLAVGKWISRIDDDEIWVENHLEKKLNFCIDNDLEFVSGIHHRPGFDQVDPPHIFRLGWGADFPDPDNFMNLFISSSGNNRLRWSNPRYDELVALGATLIDPAERQRVYDKAQRILTETDAAMIPLFVATQNLLIKPYVKRFEMNSMELMYLKKVSTTTNPIT